VVYEAGEAFHEPLVSLANQNQLASSQFTAIAPNGSFRKLGAAAQLFAHCEPQHDDGSDWRFASLPAIPAQSTRKMEHRKRVHHTIDPGPVTVTNSLRFTNRRWRKGTSAVAARN
jgi:hypothetical protein